MDLKPGLTLYNPDLLSKSDLIRGFVARQPLLNDLLDDLRRAGPGGTSQHHLLLGQRGLGKTTLLRRLAFAIEDDGELAQIWQPLVFPEEQYNVATLADFWLNCCDALSDALERAGRTAEFERLDDRIAQVKDKHTAEGLTILVDEAIRLNRRLLLLVDNIDIVLDRVGEEQEWEFRRVLSEEKRLTIIGASSRAIESFYEHGRAFYDYFQVHELKGLEDAEAFELLRHLATTLDAKGVEKMLAEQPGRVRTLRLLTGGNPRTLVLLFQVFQQSPESDIQRDLEHLLDLYTPLYKARFEELPAQAQQVVDAMALHWDPLTAAELAALTSLPINVASAQLKRLDDLGVIEKVPWFGEKKLAFQIGERFFNIWYLMRASRRARRKLVWLVKFMQAWFTEDELRQRAQAFLGCDAEGMGHERYAEMSFAYAEASSDYRLKQRLEHAGLRAVMADDVVRRTFDFTDLPQTVRDRRQHMEAMRKLAETLPESRADWGDINPQEFGRLLLGSPHFDLAEKRHVIEGLSKLSSTEFAGLVDQIRNDESRLRRGYTSDACRLYDALARGEMTYAFDWLSASALDEGARLAYVGIHSRVSPSFGRLRPGDLVRSERAYQHMIESPDLAPLGWLGWAKLLTYHLNRHQEAEAAFHRAIELDPKQSWNWHDLGNLLTDHNRHREAEAAFRRAIELDPKQSWSWNNLGNLLTGHLNRHQEAEAAFRRAIELDPKRVYPWSNLGKLLSRDETRLAEAGAAWLRAVEIDPSHPWDRDRLLEEIQKMGRQETLRERAEDLARQTVAALPDDREAAFLLAEVLTRAGKWSEARTIFERLASDLDAEPGTYATGFCAAAVVAGKTHDVLEIFAATGANERWRPLYEALRAVQAGSPHYLRRVAPEVRHLAERLLKQIQPDLGS